MNKEYCFLFNEAFESDLDTIKDFYTSISEELSEKAQEEISQYLEILKGRPLSYQKRYRGIRGCFTPVFGFGIYFSVDEKNNIIYVVGIINTRQDLATILKRSKK